jgi:hypothetical protein
MAYSKSQRKVIRKSLKVANRLGAGKKVKKALLEAERVESNFQNLNYGDRDSQGVPSAASVAGMGSARVGEAGRRPVRSTCAQAANHKGLSAGELAQAVQRSSVPGAVCGAFGRGSTHCSPGPGTSAGKLLAAVRLRARRSNSRTVKYPVGQTITTSPGVDNSAERKQALLSYFTSGQRYQPGGLLNLVLHVADTQGRSPVRLTRSLVGEPFRPGSQGLRQARQTVRSVSSSNQVNRAVRSAKSFLGVAETNGTNTGPGVDRIEARFDAHAAAWCGYFAGTVLQKAGVRGVGSWIGSTAAIQQKAQAGQGPFSGFTQGTGRAKAGDLLLVREGGPSGHVEVITKVDRTGTVHTIGGNVGNAVRRQTHAPGTAFGVAHVKYHK